MTSSARPGRQAKPDQAVEGLAARLAALRLLDAVLRRGEPMDRAANAACLRLPSDDKALTIAIAGDALRWLVALDALIDSATDQVLAEDSKVRSALRIGLVQLLSLKTAPHAVVSTTLALLVAGPRRLAHAILSRAQRDAWELPAVPPLPPLVAERWRDAWGDAVVLAAQSEWANPPPLDLRFKSAALAESFGDGQSLAPTHRRLPRAGRVEGLPGYSEGGWWVQDLAAGIAADLFSPGEGRTALDLCAAPGGKTMQLAAAGWVVTSVDSSAKRNERLAENLARTQLSASLVTSDIARFEAAEPFDAVLLDAPCSATGTYRRHPDVVHRIGDTDIATLAKLQRDMLARAARWVKPGGLLVFATCSMEPAEGEAIIAHFLGLHPEWTVEAIRAEELPAGVLPTIEGFVRTLPKSGDGAIGLDGFFVARLRAPWRSGARGPDQPKVPLHFDTDQI